MALGLLGVVLALLVAALILTTAAVTSHRARAAADLAALAAAGRATATAGDVCGEARRVARLHGATVRECQADGVDVEIEVAIRPPGAAARFGEARARARAGPERPLSSAPVAEERARAPA